jgi:hypothetical protein
MANTFRSASRIQVGNQVRNLSNKYFRAKTANPIAISKQNFSVASLGKPTLNLLYQLPALTSSNPLTVGIGTVALGRAFNASSLKESLGVKLGGALGALGGALTIFGGAKFATAMLPTAAALPASMIGGALIGADAFKGLGSALSSEGSRLTRATGITGGLSTGAATIMGAGLGLGFGIYGMIDKRRNERRQMQSQARAIAAQNEEIGAAISRTERILPLFSESTSDLQDQLDRNLSVISYNWNEVDTANRIRNVQLKKLGAKVIGSFRAAIARSNITPGGSDWFLAADAQNSINVKQAEANREAASARIQLNNERANLLYSAKDQFRSLAYQSWQMGTELDYYNRVLERNLNELYSNKYSDWTQRASGESALSAGRRAFNTVEGYASKAERGYYGLANYSKSLGNPYVNAQAQRYYGMSRYY